MIDDGSLWMPPPAAALEAENDLSSEQRAWLSDRFVPHPGRTVMDPVVMGEPIMNQPVVYVATAPDGDDPLDTLPPELQGGCPAGWTMRTLDGGHWPMVTKPQELTLLISEACCHDNQA